MKKSAIKIMPRFFEKYIHLVDDEELVESLKKSLLQIENIDVVTLELLGNKTYAPGKWTVKDILQHLIDNERIQSYRALRFGRKDFTELPGYDEQLLSNHTNAKERTVINLIKEFSLVRKTSILLFENFDDDVLMNTGKANGIEISVLSLGFVLIGHLKHHLKIIDEKYLPLIHGCD